MDEPKYHVTRRGLILGGLSVGVAGASGVTAGGTLAWFRDVEAGRNSIQAGTLNLEFGSGSSLDLTTDLSPGSSISSSVELTSPGTLAGWLDIDVSYKDSGGDADPNQVAKELEVSTLDYGGTDLLTQVSHFNTNGIKDLEDLAKNNQTSGETTANDLIDLADPGNGTLFEIELTLQNGTNNLAGNSIEITVTFYLNQTDGM